jgi:hypothetical protein
MRQQVRQIEFKKLRFAYETVKRFLEEESLDTVDSLNTKIVYDLRLAGDDNFNLLVHFIKKFALDYKDFEYNKHFYSEGELFGSGAALINLLSLSVWIPLKTIELLTLNKLHLPKPSLYRPSREVLDMSFKDLLTWYVEGKYTTAAEIKYEIKYEIKNVT